MTDFQNVLIATDFSESAARAVDVAVELARPFEGRLTLLHVCHIPTQAYAYEVVMPAERIVAIASKRRVGVIVIGTRGRRGLPRMLLGSVAERVVRTADVPMLTVPSAESART